jgi:hypothetical protein
MAETGERRSQILVDQDSEREATWRERTLNAEEALNAAHHEIRAQRTRLGELLGQIRYLQAEWTEEAIQRITTENTTLKQRVRQLTADNYTLDERLKAPAPTSASKTAASPSSEPAPPTQAYWAKKPTFGSTPARIETEIASGISASATMSPARTSVRSAFGDDIQTGREDIQLISLEAAGSRPMYPLATGFAV